MYMSPAGGIAETKRLGVFKRSNNCVRLEISSQEGETLEMLAKTRKYVRP
jgi:hypothetical protein